MVLGTKLVVSAPVKGSVEVTLLMETSRSGSCIEKLCSAKLSPRSDSTELAVNRNTIFHKAVSDHLLACDQGT